MRLSGVCEAGTLQNTARPHDGWSKREEQATELQLVGACGPSDRQRQMEPGRDEDVERFAFLGMKGRIAGCSSG